MPMLRPATPLAVLFFTAFALLLLSVLSTPIIRAIPLATFKGVDFGVFGFNDNGRASPITIGYSTAEIFNDADNSDFSLPSSTRTSLSSILIIHPVAAFLALICFGLAVAAHFHGPSHSPRYLLILVLVTFPTLLVSLLAFLVDILLFVPHMAWGGWIVLAATIIVMVCIVLTCAMRRTLVSRKARQKRIAENAEMNGQNYYDNRSQPDEQAAYPTQAVLDSLPKADSPPPMDKEVGFASYELQKTKSDDRQPLNPSLNGTTMMGSSPTGDNASARYYGEQGPPGSRGRGGPSPVDQYGNPISGGAYGQPLRHQGSDGTMGSQRSQGPPGPMGAAGAYRGRGGPPRGGPPRGGYGPRGGFRGGPGGRRGPPPPGWDRNGRGGPMMMGAGPMGRGQRGPPPGYENGQPYGGPPPQDRGYTPYQEVRGPPQRSAGDNLDPATIGQAIEMDHINGVPSPTFDPSPNYGLRDSDADVQGMINLQQQAANQPSTISPTSEYSRRESEYVPPRAGWNAQPPQPQPTLPAQYRNNSSGTLPSSGALRGLSPVQGSPVELPTETTPNLATAVHRRKQSADYYEDVDPRFASNSSEALPQALNRNDPTPRGPIPSSTVMPNALVPGNFSRPSPPPTTQLPPPPPPANNSNNYPRGLTADNSGPTTTTHLNASSSYEELPDGARSPAASEASHFTSVSQRPVNPNWRPPPQQQQMPTQNRAEGLLESNPDFGLPGLNARGRGRGGMRGGMGMGMGRGAMGMPGMGGMGAGGRYPGPEAI